MTIAGSKEKWRRRRRARRGASCFVKAGFLRAVIEVADSLVPLAISRKP
jgi:hypothetical protein